MKPTIFIPGIPGNTIVNSNSIDFQLMYSAIRRYFKGMDMLNSKEDEQFEVDDNVIGERAQVERLAYKEMDSFICTQNELQLFVFNYDWRRTNAYNRKKLIEFVNYLKAKLAHVPRQDNFNFITHNVGSSSFRAYLKELSGNYGEMNKTVLTVPPNKRSVEALTMLVLGKSYLINPADSFRKMVRTFPALYDLIPTYAGAFKSSDPGFDIFNRNCLQSNMYKVEDVVAIKRMFEVRLANTKEFVFQKGFKNKRKLNRNKKRQLRNNLLQKKNRIEFQIENSRLDCKRMQFLNTLKTP